MYRFYIDYIILGYIYLYPLPIGYRPNQEVKYKLHTLNPEKTRFKSLRFLILIISTHLLT